MFTKDHVNIVEKEAIASSAFLDIPLSGIYVTTPPAIDDFDSTRRIVWTGIVRDKDILSCAIHFGVGASVEDSTLVHMTRKTVSLSLLIHDSSWRDFASEMLQAYRLDSADLLGSIISLRTINGLDYATLGEDDLNSARSAVEKVVEDAIDVATRRVRDYIETFLKDLENC